MAQLAHKFMSPTELPIELYSFQIATSNSRKILLNFYVIMSLFRLPRIYEHNIELGVYCINFSHSGADMKWRTHCDGVDGSAWAGT
jgi:hypothetical protein